MHASIKSIRYVLGMAAALGLASGLSLREARASDPSNMAVYLWKDTKGNCPASCDNNQYACPCRTTSEQ